MYSLIKTDRLLLRPIVDSDINNIFAGLSDPKVVQHYAVSFGSLEATKEQMTWYAEDEQMWWAICSLDNQTFYGAGGLNDISNDKGKAEIGIWLLPKYWGQGIMKEALPLITDFGLKELGLNRIEGFVESDNVNCKNALSKLDFHLEKTIENFEIKNGKSISVDVYAKCR